MLVFSVENAAHSRRSRRECRRARVRGARSAEAARMKTVMRRYDFDATLFSCRLCHAAAMPELMLMPIR